MPSPAIFADLWSKDRQAQNDAFSFFMATSKSPVDWAYEVWDDVIAHLSSKDNHHRAIAAQLLCRLAKSDPEGRLRRDFPALVAVTRDERTVTARHALQALWEIGAAGPWQRDLLLEELANRFTECVSEKNCTLVRYDVVVDLRRLYDSTCDDRASELALALIAQEADDKYRKKYLTAWR